MAEDPKNLNIPFPPRDWFWLHALIVISVFAVGAAGAFGYLKLCKEVLSPAILSLL